MNVLMLSSSIKKKRRKGIVNVAKIDKTIVRGLSELFNLEYISTR